MLPQKYLPIWNIKSTVFNDGFMNPCFKIMVDLHTMNGQKDHYLRQIGVFNDKLDIFVCQFCDLHCWLVSIRHNYRFIIQNLTS